jgi:hypothetical protein
MRNANFVVDKTTLENGRFLSILRVGLTITTASETTRP